MFVMTFYGTDANVKKYMQKIYNFPKSKLHDVMKFDKTIILSTLDYSTLGASRLSVYQSLHIQFVRRVVAKYKQSSL